MVAKANKWSLLKLLTVVIFAGSCHVAITIGLGLVAMGGRHLIDHDHGIDPERKINLISSAVLFGLGMLYIILHFIRIGHRHEKDQAVAEKISIASLIISMTLSPCMAVILIFPLITPQTTGLLVLVSLVLLITTVGTMLILVTLSYIGIERLKFNLIDRYEKLIIGVTLCLLSLVTFLIMSGHKHIHH